MWGTQNDKKRSQIPENCSDSLESLGSGRAQTVEPGGEYLSRWLAPLSLLMKHYTLPCVRL